MKFTTEELEKDFTEKEVTTAPKKRRGRKKKFHTAEISPETVQEETKTQTEQQEQVPLQSATPNAQVVVMLTPESCAAIYSVLGRILAAGVTKFKDVPSEIASRAMEFTEEEKKVLGPQTAKVLNKYAPQWLVKYADELMLITLLTGSIMGKLRAVDEWKETNTINVSDKKVTTMPAPDKPKTEAATVQ